MLVSLRFGLYFCSIFLVYLAWCKVIVFCFLFLCISIPRKVSASPKFLSITLLFNRVYISCILWLDGDITRISSTWTIRIIGVSLFDMYIDWSSDKGFISNFDNISRRHISHSRTACFSPYKALFSLQTLSMLFGSSKPGGCWTYTSSIRLALGKADLTSH